MSKDRSDPTTWEPMSPATQHIGMVMSHWGPDLARFEMVIKPFHLNRHGIPHGGYYAMLLDTAMGHSGAFSGDPDQPQLTLTLNMSINYLSRPRGQRLIAEGKRVGGGTRTYFAEGWLTDETGELIATAQGVFRLRA